ncbi:MAG: DUF4867 family protein [Clostridia bacterium]
MLEALRQKNPDYPIYDVHDEAFRPYGRVLDYPSQGLMEACLSGITMPESGSCYVPTLPELEACADAPKAKHVLRGEGSFQLGVCWGYNSALTALEYHRASEHNVAVTDLVLLLGKQQDMREFAFDASSVVGFFVPKGTVIEVYATSLHYCPCQVHDSGFVCIVGLPQGTNTALEHSRPQEADGRLLWAKDKWLIAHKDSDELVKDGAYPGIHGTNWQVRY